MFISVEGKYERVLDLKLYTLDRQLSYREEYK
jgi:hypothetical protein